MLAHESELELSLEKALLHNKQTKEKQTELEDKEKGGNALNVYKCYCLVMTSLCISLLGK